MGVDELWEKLASAYDSGIQASGKEVHFLILTDSPWRELTAIAFGIGMGLTLDEFALWLNLEDVYWQQKGRQSIDAVVVAATLLAVTLIGLPFWIDVTQAFLTTAGIGGVRLDPTESTAILAPVQVAGALLAAACLYKGKRLPPSWACSCPSSP